MESSFDLPDSTDWISTSLPAFEPLEAALRCEVCKEFYTNPVITSCSHTFCSICIRRSIATDGKCPACKTACQADRLLPNIAVRDIAAKFQEARPKALELARAANKDGAETLASGKKRKLQESDIEGEKGEPVRQTRARLTRKSSRRHDDRGTDDMPVVIPDSEEEKDEEYVPEGMQKCPICQRPKPAAKMFDHVGMCTGADAAAGRATRSKKNSAFPNALQSQQKEPTPPAARLPGLNYALLTESALRKKLKDLGIPNWGPKALLIKRHQEWLNLYNSNCDASDAVRKRPRELLKELDEWERTQGGNANTKESHIMRKDFDGQGHAANHKSQFDDLIANARKRAKAAQKSEEEGGHKDPTQQNQEQSPEAAQPNGSDPNLSIDPSRPYENNEAALSSIRNKVEDANGTDPAAPWLSRETSRASDPTTKKMPPADEPTGFQNPFASPSRNMPMFALPEEPVVDVENSTTVQ